MTCEITPQERAAIAEAIAAGNITKVPRGQSGLPAMKWDDATKSIVHVETQVRTAFNYGRPGCIPPATLHRRQRVKGYHAAGMTTQEIADREQVCLTTVRTDLRRLGLTPITGNAERARDAQAEERRRVTFSMHEEGKTPPEIGRALGISRKTVGNYLRKAGFEPNRASTWGADRRKVWAEKRAARVATINAGLAEGKTQTEIAREMGLSWQTIARELRAAR